MKGCHASSSVTCQTQAPLWWQICGDTSDTKWGSRAARTTTQASTEASLPKLAKVTYWKTWWTDQKEGANIIFPSSLSACINTTFVCHANNYCTQNCCSNIRYIPIIVVPNYCCTNIRYIPIIAVPNYCFTINFSASITVNWEHLWADCDYIGCEYNVHCIFISERCGSGSRTLWLWILMKTAFIQLLPFTCKLFIQT